MVELSQQRPKLSIYPKRHSDLTLLCVPPTRLTGPCRRVLTKMLINIECRRR